MNRQNIFLFVDMFWTFTFYVWICIGLFSVSALNIEECLPMKICSTKSSSSSSSSSATEDPCCFRCVLNTTCKATTLCCIGQPEDNGIRHHGSCLRPKVTDKLARLRTYSATKLQLFSPPYFTINTCKLFTSINNSLTSKTPLNGSQNCQGNGMGTNIPVMSRTTRNIYVNEACARCNGEDDVETWYFAADISKPLNPYMTSMLTISDVIEKGVFTPPPGVDVSNLTCIATTIGDEDAVIFVDLNFHDICSFSDNPYAYKNSVFQIIQCETCGVMHFKVLLDKNKVCSEDNGARFPFKQSFITILDTSSFKNDERTLPLSAVSRCGPHHVSHPFKDECFYVFCPEGMIRENGSCSYFGAKWTGSFLLHIYLTPLQQRNITSQSIVDFMQNSSHDISNFVDLECIKHNWTSFLYIIEATSETLKHVKALRILLQKNTRGIPERPEKLVRVPKSCFETRWRFKSDDGNETEFLPLLYPYKLRAQTLTNDFTDEYMTVDNMHLIQTRKGKTKISTDIEISKNYFCNQVLLPVSEVTFGFGQILVNASGRVVTSNAYNLIREGLYGESLPWNQSWVAVCVEDFNPEYVMDTTTSSVRISSMTIENYLVLVFILMTFRQLQ